MSDITCLNNYLLSVEVALGQMQSCAKDSLDKDSVTSAKVSSNFVFPSSLDIARNSLVSPSKGGVYKIEHTELCTELNCIII